MALPLGLPLSPLHEHPGMHALRQAIRRLSIEKLSQHAANPRVLLAELPEFYGRVHGYWMSIILIAGPALRVTFKVHFDTKDVQKLSLEMLKQLGAEANTALMPDLVRELCNLIAGSIKTQLEAVGVRSGTSLPFVTRGFDEVFYKYPDVNSRIGDHWTLYDGPRRIHCSVLFEVFDKRVLEQLSKINGTGASSEATDSGEVELL